MALGANTLADLTKRSKASTRGNVFLAQIEEQLGNDELAAGLYRAVGEGEHQTDALLRLSVVLLRQEKGDEALKVLAELRQKLSPVPARLFNAEAQIMRQLNKAAR